jgi:hypothetical protein
MTPNPENTPPQPTTGTKIKRKVKKILKWLVALIVLILLFVFYWKYFYTYSDGYRAGLLQKFSRKGTIFKTYEGELVLSSVSGSSGNSNTVIASEKFFFSVNSDSLAARLDTLQGRSVIVHYRQKNSPVFWRGDSPYLVDGVKPR